MLPTLPYKYDALEPYIDARTLEIHHTKHHQGYIDKVNKALDSIGYDAPQNIEELLKNLNTVPSSVRQVVRANGGGHANHSLYWSIMAPTGSDNQPKKKKKKALETVWPTGIESFKADLTTASLGLVGSGWTWLYVDEFKQLKLGCTYNHDTPLMRGFCNFEGTPILVMDIWEHAYYLKYQNRRADYIEAFWKVLNWEAVNQNYLQALRQ